MTEEFLFFSFFEMIKYFKIELGAPEAEMRRTVI
jgi:hypothetical protein